MPVDDFELKNPAQYFGKLAALNYKPLLTKMNEMADPKKGNYGGPYRELFFEVPALVLQVRCRSSEEITAETK